MSTQYPGGLITKTPVTPSGPYQNSTASGIWTLNQQAYWAKLGQWPTAGNPPPDPQFNYVTMLLHGDGTNGAQNNTFLDSGPNTFTITRNGNTTQGSFSPYGSNWSNYFDGSGDYLTTPSTAALGFGTGDFTIECWTYLIDSNALYVFDMRFSSGADTYVYINASTLEAAVNGVGLTVTGMNFLNNWVHIAIVRASGTVKIYVNGVQQATASSSGSIANSGIAVGARYTGSESFYGYISNFRIVKGTAVYTSAFTPSTTPLTAITNTSLLTCSDNRFIDDSGNGLTITVNGTPSVQRFNPFGTSTAYSTSVIGGSGYFDGNGDNLSYGSSSSLSFSTGDFTVEAWVYITSVGTAFNIFNVGNASTGSYSLYINPTTNKITSTRYGDAGGAGTTTNGITLNTWTHIAAVRISGTAYVYVNGVVDSGATYSMGSVTNTGASTGLIWGDPYTGVGYVSNLRVVKGTGVYTTNFTPPTAPLTSVTDTQLLLLTTNGAIFDNAMMNNLETVGNAQISTSVVKYGTGSLAFDGTGDYLIPPSGQNVTFGTGNFTIEGWFYWNSLASESAIMWGNGVGWTFYIYPANKLQWGTTSPQAAANLLTGSTTLATGQWYHIAVTRSSNTLTLWVNGVSDGTVTDSNNYSANGRLAIGISHSNEYFNGYMDDVRITKGVARYTATFTPPTQAFSNIGPT